MKDLIKKEAINLGYEVVMVEFSDNEGFDEYTISTFNHDKSWREIARDEDVILDKLGLDKNKTLLRIL